MTSTPNFNLPMPDAAADVDDEFYRLQTAMLLLDVLLMNFQTGIASKSAVGHTHTQAQVTGLVAALAAKMDASKTFRLVDLTDVSGAADAAAGYLFQKTALGFGFTSAAAALGNHQHASGDIVGLADALALLAPKASPAFTGTPTAPTQAAGNNSTRLATTAFVMAAINVIKGSVSTAYDTLAEVEAAITALLALDVANGTGLLKTGTLNGGNLSFAVDKGTAADITAGTANKFPDAAAVKAGIAANSPLPFTTESAPAANTLLQNTSGKPLLVSGSRLVTVSAQSSGSVTVSILSGTLSTNLAVKASDRGGAGYSGIQGGSNTETGASASYVVPPGNYYRIDISSTQFASVNATYTSAVN